MEKERISNLIVVLVTVLMVVNSFFLTGITSKILAVIIVLVALGNLIWLMKKR